MVERIDATIVNLTGLFNNLFFQEVSLICIFSNNEKEITSLILITKITFILTNTNNKNNVSVNLSRLVETFHKYAGAVVRTSNTSFLLKK